MADLDLLTEIHTDVRYIKDTLDSHIRDDKHVAQEFIRPLWEAHQQEKGAASLKKVLWAAAMSSLAIIAGYFGGQHK